MAIPNLLELNTVWPRLFSVESGRFELLDDQGNTFPLPLAGNINKSLKTSDLTLNRGPNLKSASTIGKKTYQPLVVTFSTNHGSVESYAVFDSESHAKNWEESLQAFIHNATKLKDIIFQEEYDGYVQSINIEDYRVPWMKKVDITFQSFDPFAWRSNKYHLEGLSVACINNSSFDAYPDIQLTVNSLPCTITNGIQTLQIYSQIGTVINISNNTVDGRIYNQLDELIEYSGELLYIPPGGCTISASGVNSLIVSYREPSSQIPLLEEFNLALPNLIRKFSNVTTQPLLPNAFEYASVKFSPLFKLIRVSTNSPARVRIYTNNVNRENDVNRPPGLDPSPLAGVLLDVIMTDQNKTLWFTPPVLGYSQGQNLADLFSVTIDNLDVLEKSIVCTFEYLDGQ